MSREPDWISQTHGVEDARAWFTARADEMKQAGAAWVRFSERSPDSLLVEGWRVRPDDEGSPRWRSVTERLAREIWQSIIEDNGGNWLGDFAVGERVAKATGESYSAQVYLDGYFDLEAMAKRLLAAMNVSPSEADELMAGRARVERVDT